LIDIAAVLESLAARRSPHWLAQPKSTVKPTSAHRLIRLPTRSSRGPKRP